MAWVSFFDCFAIKWGLFAIVSILYSKYLLRLTLEGTLSKIQNKVMTFKID